MKHWAKPVKKQHVNLSGLTQGSPHTSKNTLRAPQDHPRTLQEMHLHLWCPLGPPQGRPGTPEDHVTYSQRTSPETPEMSQTSKRGDTKTVTIFGPPNDTLITNCREREPPDLVQRPSEGDLGPPRGPQREPKGSPEISRHSK